MSAVSRVDSHCIAELVDSSAVCIRQLTERIAETPLGKLRDELYSELMFLVKYRSEKKHSLKTLNILENEQ
jgi:hypothetical protein